MTIEIKVQAIKIFFYNGFEKPKLLANNLEEMQDVIVRDNYLGDQTEELMDELDGLWYKDFKDSKKLSELNEVLGYYGMFANPTLEQLVEASLAWFDKGSVPSEHFEDFGNKYEVHGIANRIYDDFKIYLGYENQYIIENYIRYAWVNTVVESFDTMLEAEEFMNENDLWDDCTLFGVNFEGRAFYPQF